MTLAALGPAAAGSLTACAVMPWSSGAEDKHTFDVDEVELPVREPASTMAPPYIRKDEYTRYRSVDEAISYRDVVVGMGYSDVRSAWGEPFDVEVSGESSYGNQRWVYLNGLSNRASLSEKRVVYFEAGRVVGWETLRR